MVLHKTWYTIVVIGIGAVLIMGSATFLLAPETMVATLFAGFSLDPLPIKALSFAFLGTCIRNIVMGLFLIYYAFRDTRTLLMLLIVRFAIDGLDFFGGLMYNPDLSAVIPILPLLGVEIALIYVGNRSLQ